MGDDADIYHIRTFLFFFDWFNLYCQLSLEMFDFILSYPYSFFYLNVGQNLCCIDACVFFMFTFLYNNKNCTWLRWCFCCMAVNSYLTRQKNKTKNSCYHVNEEDAPLGCAWVRGTCARIFSIPLFLDAVIPSTCFWPLGGESETTPALQPPPCETWENTMYRTQHTRASVLCFYDAHVSQCEHACPLKVIRQIGIVQSIGVSSLPPTIDAWPRLLYFCVWSLPEEFQGFSFSEDESGFKQEVMFRKGEGNHVFGHSMDHNTCRWLDEDDEDVLLTRSCQICYVTTAINWSDLPAIHY